MPSDTFVQQATEKVEYIPPTSLHIPGDVPLKPEANSSENGVVSNTVAKMNVAAPVEVLQGLAVWGPYRVAEEAETPVAYVPVVLKHAAIADEDFAGLGAGWFSDWNEKHASVRIANETEIPLVYVLSMLGPLYWGVLQPGERVTRQVGRVWFTVTCYPYTGNNEPSTTQAVLGVLIPAAVGIIAVVTGGLAIGAAVPAAGTAGAALAAVATSPLVAGASAAVGGAVGLAGPALWAKKEFVDAVEKVLNKVEKKGHYANGDWIHVRGGIKKDQPYSAWSPMRFEV